MAKILIVDDEVGIRELLSEILRDEGHDIILAENAAAARAAAGRASRMRPTASSSCAAVRNHASNTDGGSATPASSIAWKNGGNRHPSCACTCA